MSRMKCRCLKRHRALADEAAKDKLKPERSILYVRSEATDEELGEMVKTNNPE